MLDSDAPDHDSLDEDFSTIGEEPSRGEGHLTGNLADPLKISRWVTWPLSASLNRIGSSDGRGPGEATGRIFLGTASLQGLRCELECHWTGTVADDGGRIPVR